MELTDEVMPGVVSIPHGWGHSAAGSQLSVASEHAGVNSNLLADETLVEPLSGNAILNGIPVEVVPAPVPVSAGSDRLEHRRAAVAALRVGGVRHPRDRGVGAAVRARPTSARSGAGS